MRECRHFVTYRRKEINMIKFIKSNNSDNTTSAVKGLDLFTKNWCLNCEETDKQHDFVFRCSECEFETEDYRCLVKKFARNHKHDYPMDKFGSMR